MNKQPNAKDQASSTMTQEDVWRELELLPMWHLRAGLPPLAPATQAVYPVPTVPVAHVEAPVPAEAVVAEPVEAMAWTQVGSEDGLWLFVSAMASLSADEWQLLQNMAKAMRIRLHTPQPMNYLNHDWSASPAKMLIAFGEAAAQSLLANQTSLTNLRGQLHACHGRTLVATHALAHLLQQPLDKAETWHDLRLAMQALADLT